MPAKRKFPHWFKVFYSPRSTHWIQCCIWPDVLAMRKHLRKETGNPPGRNSVNTATCYTPSRFAYKEGCVSRLHFCREHLTLSTITHECLHAAFSHALILGYTIENNENVEECIAYDVGALTDTIIAYLDSNKIPVRYECVNRRAV